MECFYLLAVVFIIGFHQCSCLSESRQIITRHDIDLGKFEGTEILTVRKDIRKDSTHFNTIQAAVDSIPFGNNERIKIHILPVTYEEKVLVPTGKDYVSFIGDKDQRNNTIIVMNDASDLKRSYTVGVESNYFCATEITIQNKYKGKQAVALMVSGDNAFLYKIGVLGWQDALFDEAGRHFYLQSYIEGAVDFICGSARSLYMDCDIHSIANDPSSCITAHDGSNPSKPTGFSFAFCSVTATGQVYLGRPWHDQSTVTFSYCSLDNIAPQGWSNWAEYRKTSSYKEYRNWGKGADLSHRVSWMKQLNSEFDGYEEIESYTDFRYIDGQHWLNLYF